jgi:hypothetical protein
VIKCAVLLTEKGMKMKSEKVYPMPEAFKNVQPWEIVFSMAVNQQPQRQDALNNQLRDLIFVANRLGCYDAADYLKRVISE